MSQILIADINKGKQETVDWLKSKGLSRMVYANFIGFLSKFTASDALKQSGGQFNPLPEGC